MMDGRVLVITGPTATGKTARAVQCAAALGGEIVSADSRQIYRGMDLGTGKDLHEYGSVPYHMIDIAPAGARYNLYQYLREARSCLDDIAARGKLPVIAGGTGMYVEALVRGTELPDVPENPQLRRSLQGRSLSELTEMLSQLKTMHNTTDVDTAQRAIRAIEIARYYKDHPEISPWDVAPQPLDAVIVAVDIPRDLRRARISSRLKARIDAGMVDEVRRLLDSGIAPEDLIYYGLEYKYLTRYVIGEITYDEMYSGLEIAIHQFAKRQMTWFRGMERRGHTLHWLPWDMDETEFVDKVRELLRQ